MRIARSTKRKLFYAIILLSLIIFGLIVLNIHNNSSATKSYYGSIPNTPAITSGDKGAFEVWGKFDNGYGLIDTLYFDKKVSSKIIHLDQNISSITLVKKYGYEINIDELTLNGIAPADYERKLKYKDGDLIEITDTTEFNLTGSGKLVIAARAPVSVASTEQAAHFPHNANEYYSYSIGQNVGSLSINVPDSNYLFHEEMLYPGSGHPDALIDWYLANDDNYLYVFTEVFGDNTLDHGKDYAKARIKSVNGIKEYAVYTTPNNQYGEWKFAYTNTKPEYAHQHMLYLIKIPRQDIPDVSVDISFEYYGTLSMPTYDYVVFRKIDDEGNPVAGAKFKVYDEINERYLYSSCNYINTDRGGFGSCFETDDSDEDIDQDSEEQSDDSVDKAYIAESDENGNVKFYLSESYYNLYSTRVVTKLAQEGPISVVARDNSLLTPDQIEEYLGCASSDRCWEHFSITDEQDDGRVYDYEYSYYRTSTMMYSYIYYTLEGSGLTGTVVRNYSWSEQDQVYYYVDGTGFLEYNGYNNNYDAAIKAGKLKLSEVYAPKGYNAISDTYLTLTNVESIDDFDYKYTANNVINQRETFDINGTIRWIDDGNSSGIRPTKSTIKLYRNGELIDQVEVQKAEDADLWHFTFPNLLKYDRSGNEYKYTITQNDIPQYASDITNFDVVNEYSTNTPTPANPSNPTTGDNSLTIYVATFAVLSTFITLLAYSVRKTLNS